MSVADSIAVKNERSVCRITHSSLAHEYVDIYLYYYTLTNITTLWKLSFIVSFISAF